MADSQVPLGMRALDGSITEPAWRVKPSWYARNPAEIGHPASAMCPTSQTSAQVDGGPQDSRLRPNARSGSGDDALRAVARPRSPSKSLRRSTH